MALSFAVAALSIPAAAPAALPIPATARTDRDRAGHIALGYWNREAPIGGRYIVSKNSAIDFGLGFEKQAIEDDPTTAAPGDAKKNLQLNLAVGSPFTVLRRQRVAFFIRPGALLEVIPTYNQATLTDPYRKKTETELELTGIVGVEWFVTNGLSLSVGNGVKFASREDVSMNQMTTGEFKSRRFLSGLEATDVTSFGFHFYF